MKRPLAAVVLAYAAGLLFAQFLHPPVAALFGSALLVLVLVLVLEKFRPLLIWPLLVLTGWTNLACRTEIISPDDLRTQFRDESALVTVRGEMAESPRLGVFERNGEKVWHSLVTIHVREIRRAENFLPAAGDLLVTTPGILESNFFCGQPVEISGILARPARPVAEGLFDYPAYLATHGIFYHLATSSTADWQIIGNPAARLPVSDRFLAWSQTTLARGLPAQDEPLELLWAMTLGWRPALTDEVSAPFMQSGTMHIFAISGLHIALIAAIFAALLRAMQVPRFWCGVVIIPLIWFYTGATGWQPSAIRSTIMMTIIIGGWMLKRPGDLLNSLATAAFIILLWDPQQLFQASFQLSFFVVLSIALLLPPLEKVRDRWLQTDPLLPRELLPRWQRWLHPVLRLLLTSLAVSLSAWCGSWPLTAFYFHLFSPVTLLANLIIVPLSSAALACNLGSLLCGDWFPWATELFNHSGWLWMKLMVDTSVTLTKLPGAFFYVRSPTAADFMIYYSALFAISSGVAFQKRWRILALVCVVSIAGFYGWRWHEARQTTTVTVLPLNGGSATFIHDGKSGDLLVDCGDTNVVDFITTPFLHAQGVNHLPQLVLTQGDVRDVGAAQVIGEQFQTGQLITSGAKFRSPIYRESVRAFEQPPRRHQTVNPGDNIGAWQVLHPAVTNNFPQADDNSLVLKGEIHGVKILLLSDLGRPGHGVLLNRAEDLRADIVVTGLPEKTEPLGEGLLDAIQPKIIVVMDSQFPATKRASRVLSERLEQRHIPVIYTRKSGAVTIVVKPDRWELRTMDGQRFTSDVSSK